MGTSPEGRQGYRGGQAGILRAGFGLRWATSAVEMRSHHSRQNTVMPIRTGRMNFHLIDPDTAALTACLGDARPLRCEALPR
jgi:hypothetical protein